MVDSILVGSCRLLLFFYVPILLCSPPFKFPILAPFFLVYDPFYLVFSYFLIAPVLCLYTILLIFPRVLMVL